MASGMAASSSSADVIKNSDSLHLSIPPSKELLHRQAPPRGPSPHTLPTTSYPHNIPSRQRVFQLKPIRTHLELLRWHQPHQSTWAKGGGPLPKGNCGIVRKREWVLSGQILRQIPSPLQSSEAKQWKAKETSAQHIRVCTFFPPKKPKLEVEWR